MELGGNAPFLVFEDADLDAAVEGAMIAKMRNIGEACTAANRFHVAESVADEFAEKLAERMGAMKVGRGTEDGVKVGPLIDGTQRGKVAELVDGRGRQGREGARRRRGRADGAGYFYEPTVLADVPDDARLLQEEIFGPVAPVNGFTTRRRRSPPPTTPSTASSPTSTPATSSARSASRERWRPAWSASTRASSPTPAAPFGGVKASGFGREGGHEGIEEYLETKYVAMAL